jgi:hypothetical protein
MDIFVGAFERKQRKCYPGELLQSAKTAGYLTIVSNMKPFVLWF